jgi:hypothetical protein
LVIVLALLGLSTITRLLAPGAGFGFAVGFAAAFAFVAAAGFAAALGLGAGFGFDVLLDFVVATDELQTLPYLISFHACQVG